MKKGHDSSICKHALNIRADEEKRQVFCFDANSGKVLWTGAIGTRAKIEASPTLGDGKIYFQDHNGQVFVVAADPEKFTLLHQVHFGDRTVRDQRCSLALANNRVFLRSQKTLYCFGK